jgi:uncharacterized protein
MIAVFVDTNIFLRFFTRDDLGRHEKAVSLFQKARAGKISLMTGPPVLFELAWTLKSAYRQPDDRILAAIEAIMTIEGLSLFGKAVVEQAVFLARNTGVAFADAYIAAGATMNNADQIATFNTADFKRLNALPLYPL